MVRSLLAVLLVAGLAACSAPKAVKPRPTPSDPLVALYRAQFLHACEVDTTSARQSYCECTEDALEARFTIGQLNRLMKVPALHRQLQSINAACAKSAGLELAKPGQS
jgi:hypothetical protein